MRTFILIVLNTIVLVFITEVASHFFFVPNANHFLQNLSHTQQDLLHPNYLYMQQFPGIKSTQLPGPPAQIFSRQKAPNTYRILVIGESTSRGFPYPVHLAFPAQLEHMLNNATSNKHVEVLNFSISASTTTVGHKILREAVDLSPDLVIIYYGHNEFIGIGGAGIHQTWQTNLHSLLNKSNIVQILQKASTPKAPATNAMLLERMSSRNNIPYKSKRYQKAHKTFANSYKQILALLAKHQISYITCAPARNLREFPPLGFKDDSKASLYYSKGLQFIQSNKLDSARHAFSNASDHDAIRLRATSQIVETIQSLTQEFQGIYFDTQHYLDSLDSKGIAGNEVFLEHVHFSLKAHSLVAKKLAHIIMAQKFNEPLQELPSVEWTLLEELASTQILLNLYNSYPLSAYKYRNNIHLQMLYDTTSTTPFPPFAHANYEAYYLKNQPLFSRYKSYDALFFHTGLKYFVEQKNDSALLFFNKAYLENPHFIQALNNLAILSYASNQKTNAYSQFLILTKRFPDYKYGQINLAQHYFLEGDSVKLKEQLKVLKEANITFMPANGFVLDDLSSERASQK
jgi:lysophospholipase L1-like esterase